MSDIESDYLDYEYARDSEGGEHTPVDKASRNDRKVVFWLALVVGLFLVLGVVALLIR